LSGDGPEDYTDDSQQGWVRITTDDIDEIGVKGIITSIMNTVGTEMPVYLSIDIDVIDPGLAPGTGTPGELLHTPERIRDELTHLKSLVAGQPERSSGS
jgi:arginase family enzyme